MSAVGCEIGEALGAKREIDDLPAMVRENPTLPLLSQTIRQELLLVNPHFQRNRLQQAAAKSDIREIRTIQFQSRFS